MQFPGETVRSRVRSFASPAAVFAGRSILSRELPRLSALQSFIETYGYVAVFVGCLLEGETILVLGAVAAHLGFLSLSAVIAVAATAGFLGDCVWFTVGRRYGTRVFARWPSLAARADHARQRVDRHGDWIVLLMRFAIGMRTAIPIVLGAVGMPPIRFYALNAAGALLWAIAFGVAGYAFGAAVTAAIDHARHDFAIVLALALAAIATYLAIGHWRARRRAPAR